ncbi:hypothetical protein CsSME_00036499 [Camellia sinensis var. sinensis]
MVADAYPLYRRQNNGETVLVRGHINVEICSTIKVVKYLYKYIYKGYDKVALNIIGANAVENIDETSQF